MKHKSLTYILLLLTAIVAGVLSIYMDRIGIWTRSSFYSETSNQLILLKLNPQEFQRKFKFQNQNVLSLEKIADIPGDAPSDAENFIYWFSLHSNRTDFECNNFLTMRENFRKVYAGSGCCSDFTKVFVLSALIKGFDARIVFHKGHMFTEIFDANRKKWIWFDPLFMVVAGESGNLNSLYDIVVKYRHGNTPYFRTASIQRDYSDSAYYHDKRYFDKVGVILGTNFLELDELSHDVSFLNRRLNRYQNIIHQMMVGIYPKYLFIRN